MRVKLLGEEGKQKSNVHFLQTYALISAPPNTMGSATAPSLSNDPTGRGVFIRQEKRHSSKTQTRNETPESVCYFKAPFFNTNYSGVQNNVYLQNNLSETSHVTHTHTHTQSFSHRQTVKTVTFNWSFIQPENICQLPSVCLSGLTPPTSLLLHTLRVYNLICLQHPKPTGTPLLRSHTQTHTHTLVG